MACIGGDPERDPALMAVRDRFVLRFVDPARTALEIGPGGGRWTGYLLGFREVIAVDLHQPLLDELRRTVDAPNLRTIRNGGDDFPGVADGEVDFAFSFGVFVHLDVDVILSYLENLRRVMAPDGTVVVQYADKTKPAGRRNPSFSINTPKVMRALCHAAGWNVVEEETALLHHSAIVVLRS